jgi:hypothetical protein
VVDEPVLYREELVSPLFAIADMNENIGVIRRLLEEELGGEEGLDEDDG